MSTLPFCAELAFVLQDVIQNRHLVSFSLDCFANPILLSVSRPRDERSIDGCFPKSFGKHENLYRIHWVMDDIWFCLDIVPTKEIFHNVQSLPNGEWLLVRGRSSGESDKNAHIYTGDGKCRSSFYAGEGVEDVQCTESGSIWISYFDEGILSDCPLSRGGMVRLDCHYGLAFGLVETLHVETMVDCYAMNVVSDQEQWVCFYTGFQLVKIVRDRINGCWRDLPVNGAHAMAAWKGHVLFSPGYHESALRLIELSSRNIVEIRPVDAQGECLEGCLHWGRGRFMFLRAKDQFYRIDLDQIV